MFEIKEISEARNIEKIIPELRQLFASVFSMHYTNLMLTAKKENDVKMLAGFSDLIEKYFNNDFSQLKPERKLMIMNTLEKLYMDIGFDDEAAFLIAWHDLKKRKLQPSICMAKKIPFMTLVQAQECLDYLKILKKDQRTLIEVNALMVYEGSNLRSFMLYHVFKQAEKTIVHARQMAVLGQNQGHAKAMMAYLADRYPKAIVEANQRDANVVHLKTNLLQKDLLKINDPALGYSTKYYHGYRTTFSIFRTLLMYQSPNEVKKNVQWPIHRLPSYTTLKAQDTQVIPMCMFKPISFMKQTCRDDLYSVPKMK